MFSLPVASRPEHYSPQTAAKTSRLRGATVTEGVCPYCAVGCGQLIYTKGGQLIDVEGDPRSPVNEGTLCPKGAKPSSSPSTHIASPRCSTALRTRISGRPSRSPGRWTRSLAG